MYSSNRSIEIKKQVKKIARYYAPYVFTIYCRSITLSNYI